MSGRGHDMGAPAREDRGYETSHDRAKVDSRTVATSAAPPALTSSGPPSAVLALQRAAGNRAVADLLQAGPVQRQPAVPATDGDGATAGTTSGDVATDAALASIESARTLDELLARIDAMMPSPERVAPFEALTSTTTAEYSRGELEQDVMRLWRREQLDFTSAALRSVDAPATARGRAIGTRGPRFQPDREYALRRTVNLFAADYRRGADLPDVARIARRGSPFRRALRGEFERETSVLNPPAAQITSSVRGAIIDMWSELDPGTVGEIVVTFSGHGGGGWISGVDGETVSGNQLAELARHAADFNVHLVFVLDTCRAGPITTVAQVEAIRSLDARLARLPEGQRGPLEARVREIERLSREAWQVGQAAFVVGNRARDDVRRPSDDHRLAYVQALLELSRTANAFRPPDDRSGLAAAPVDRLLEARERLQWDVLAALAGSGREAPSTLRCAAAFLDAANDVINAGLEALNTELSAPSSEGAAPSAGGSSAQPVR
ncbi:MAG: hypothetical protein FIA92_13460 [Chloroflexi bacterium]|nr:hypothetical protein [Chloroflexota bacterium]